MAIIKGTVVSQLWTGRRLELVSAGLTLMRKADEDLTTWNGSVFRMAVHMRSHCQAPWTRRHIEGQTLLLLAGDFKARVRAAGLRKQLLSPSNSETL